PHPPPKLCASSRGARARAHPGAPLRRAAAGSAGSLRPVSHDVDIESWLAAEGFDLPEARDRAREVLETAGLTRPGQARMSAEREERARAALDLRLFKHCATPACVEAA